MFPYYILKARVVAAIEEPCNGKGQVSIGAIEPYYFTGMSISNLELSSRDNNIDRKIAAFNQVRGRASLFSIIFGRPNVTFYIKAGKGEIEGRARQSDDGVDLAADFDDFDISNINWFKTHLGMDLIGKITGSFKLKAGRAGITTAEGKIDLGFENIKMPATELDIIGAKFPLPDLVFSKDKESRLTVQIAKGTATIDQLTLNGGDIELDIKGKIFLSKEISNCRLNLKGSFKLSDKFAETMPFLFVIEKQKQQDGSFPLLLTGRMASPTIKVGAFTLPL